MRVPLQVQPEGFGRRGHALGPTRHSASAGSKSQDIERQCRVVNRFARVARAGAAPENPRFACHDAKPQ
jgi:hypothetical protein